MACSSARSAGPAARAAGEVILYAFDLPYVDGHDVRRLPQAERRHILEELVPAGVTGAIRLSEEVAADGEALLRTACGAGARRHRRQASRSALSQRPARRLGSRNDSFVVVGYEPSSAQLCAVESLLLAVRQGRSLVPRRYRRHRGSSTLGMGPAPGAGADPQHKPAIRIEGRHVVAVKAAPGRRDRAPRLDQRRHAVASLLQGAAGGGGGHERVRARCRLTLSP
ncbi:hypothetical protein QO011_001663 [Labrys wisconsinensis]|uniref:Uncharacterized protein n=1 Tax=Labrys wisconsinensis TaxID=425677 RepID=A0ABU0J322_9HYPH|nr:hypothetical protein [Labrys wisconsinensis]